MTVCTYAQCCNNKIAADEDCNMLTLHTEIQFDSPVS